MKHWLKRRNQSGLSFFQTGLDLQLVLNPGSNDVLLTLSTMLQSSNPNSQTSYLPKTSTRAIGSFYVLGDFLGVPFPVSAGMALIFLISFSLIL